MSKKEKNSNLENHTHIICGQEFHTGKTIFVIKKIGEQGERKLTANELYSNVLLLNQFNRADTHNIILTAVQEKLIEDLWF